MKTLVTGGLGFVGSNLVDILINSGDEFFILDDLEVCLSILHLTQFS